MEETLRGTCSTVISSNTSVQVLISPIPDREHTPDALEATPWEGHLIHIPLEAPRIANK